MVTLESKIDDVCALTDEEDEGRRMQSKVVIDFRRLNTTFLKSCFSFASVKILPPSCKHCSKHGMGKHPKFVCCCNLLPCGCDTAHHQRIGTKSNVFLCDVDHQFKIEEEGLTKLESVRMEDNSGEWKHPASV